MNNYQLRIDNEDLKIRKAFRKVNNQYQSRAPSILKSLSPSSTSF